MTSGHLVYVREGTLFAAPFDPNRLEMTGAPAPLIENVMMDAGEGSAQFDVSQTGLLAYTTGVFERGYSIVRVNRRGDADSLWDEEKVFSTPRFSPDGNLLALDAEGDVGRDIWIYDLIRSVPTRLTIDSGQDDTPNWSPDGDGERELFLGTPFAELEGEFSPNGRWIAYQSNESGTTEVYVRPFTARPGKWQISTGGGTYPRWSGDGGELFYRTTDGIMVVSVDPIGESFRADKPERRFQGPFLRHAVAADDDVAADGKGFVMFWGGDETDENQHAHLTLVINWFEELRRTLSRD